ncbi:MAG TPA: DUF4333 domain-containing protein [Acidimicrobiales bacterium]|nr:DUF4333 domain-containing protein [Acidimicrobiales bacterium]
MTQHDTAGPAAVAPGPDEGRPPSSRRGKGYFLPGTIALIALLGIGLFVGAGDLQHPAATTISGSQIASQISLGIQAQGALQSPPQVTCPRQEPVRQGLRFQCTLKGRPDKPVYVTEVDGRGQVRWSLKEL